MQRRRFLWLIFCIFTLAGCQQCALTQMEQANSARELRINQKDQQISELEIQKMALKEEGERLQKELETSQMSLDQYAKGLQALQMKNDQIRAATPEEIKKKKQIDNRLSAYNQEIEALKKIESQSLGATDSKIEKERKIEELKEDINVFLQFGLD